MLENLTPPKRVPSCRVRVVLESLEIKDREILLNAINDLDNWGALTLAKALRDRGVDLKQEVIRRHRMKMCACSRISNHQ